MKKIILSLFMLLLVMACGLPVPTPTEAALSSESDSQPPPFLGLWMNETESYTFTATSLYRVIILPENGQVNEEFSEIIQYDIANKRIVLQKLWIRVNGKPAGFDGGHYTLTYSISGNVLQLGLGTETEFATQLDPAIFTRK